jgi:hypothetical protein
VARRKRAALRRWLRRERGQLSERQIAYASWRHDLARVMGESVSDHDLKSLRSTTGCYEAPGSAQRFGERFPDFLLQALGKETKDTSLGRRYVTPCRRPTAATSGRAATGSRPGRQLSKLACSREL